MNLILFTQAQVLHQVGRKLLVEFFSRFTHLLPSKYSLPNPRPDNDYYFDSLAWKLGRPGDLPESLIQAMHEIEATAASLHHPEAIPPDDPASNPENTASTRLRQAIEQWLAAAERSGEGLAASKPREDGLAVPEQPPADPGPAPAKQAESAVPVAQPHVAPKSDEGGSTINSQPSAAENIPHSEICTPHSEAPSLTSFPSVNESGRDAPHSEAPCSPVQKSGADGQPQSDTPHSEIRTSHSEAPQSALPTPHSEGQPESDSAAFARLARLPVPEYDRVRRAEAKRLHLRLASLDDAVDRARTLEDDTQANDVYLNQLKPWPEPVLDAPALFDQVHDRYPIYLWLPSGAAVVLTLWPAHAHAFGAFTLSPRLNFTSIEPGCGKSTAFDVLGTMCPKVLCTHNLKTAVLFRVVHLHQPTLLLDELDSYLHLYPELRGLINAGHKHGASAFRCEGRGVRSFKAYAPTALAGIGHLSPTLRDRSIVIPLAKAPPGALQARFDSRRIDIETTLGRKLARPRTTSPPSPPATPCCLPPPTTALPTTGVPSLRLRRSSAATGPNAPWTPSKPSTPDHTFRSNQKSKFKIQKSANSFRPAINYQLSTINF